MQQIYKHMKYFLTVICCLMLFASCEKNNDTESSVYPTAQRTVIIYMAGENDLSTFVDENLSQIETGSKQIPTDCRLIAYIDKCGTDSLPFVVRIENGTSIRDSYFDVSEDSYSSDSEKLKEIIGKIMDRYPASDYGLVLWGHASGWLIEKDSIAVSTATGANQPKKAYGYDTGNNREQGNDGKWLNIPSMAKALAALPHKFTFIFSDCCSFQCVESAYELRNVTDYLIGSPAEIPGKGAPYEEITPYFFEQAEEVCMNICNIYNSTVYGNSYHVPMSAVKMSEMENLAQATRKLLESGNPISAFDTDQIVYYYRKGFTRILFDMNHMLKENTDAGAYAEWKEAFDRAVINKQMSTYWMAIHVSFNDFAVTEDNYGGLCMFFPQAIYDERGYSYNHDIRQMAWYYAAGIGK